MISFVLPDTRIILETDAAAIASRVTRPKPDTTDIVINEQTLLNACELRLRLAWENETAWRRLLGQRWSPSPISPSTLISCPTS